MAQVCEAATWLFLVHTFARVYPMVVRAAENTAFGCVEFANYCIY